MTVFLLNFTSSYSQFSGGVKVGYDIYATSGGIGTFSFGAFVDKISSDRFGYSVEARYGIPRTISGSYSARALNNYSLPQTILVLGDFNYKFIHALVTTRLFFGEGSYDNGGFYGEIGGGYSMVISQATYNYGFYNPEIYTVTGLSGEEEKQYSVQFTGHLFAGYEHDLGFGKVFGELGFGLPVFNNTEGIPYNLPLLIEPAIGIRF